MNRIGCDLFTPMGQPRGPLKGRPGSHRVADADWSDPAFPVGAPGDGLPEQPAMKAKARALVKARPKNVAIIAYLFERRSDPPGVFFHLDRRTHWLARSVV